MVRSFPRSVMVGLGATLIAFALHGQTVGTGTGAAEPAKVTSTLPKPAAGMPDAPRQEDTAGVTTIRAYSNLVVIDVVVADAKQNAVRGLTKDDFTLTENGKPQRIRNFEEHTVMPASETAKLTPVKPLPPGLFTNLLPAPANGPVNVILLDYLNTPLVAQPYARQQLVDYLGKIPPGTRVAIFGLTTSLTMLQGFTSDPAVLRTALLSKKGTPQVSQILHDPVYGGAQTDTTLSDNFTSTALDADQQLANIQRFQALQTAFEQDIRQKFTLNAFNLLARYLVGIPGRKNLIWFSGSFPLSIEPDVNLQDPNDSVVRNDEEVRKTDNLLTKAQIAVYPVDARGLFNDPANSAVNEAAGAAGLDAASFGKTNADAQMTFLNNTAQEHETMFAMAEDTGGHAFVNTNNLTQAVAKAVENGSNYYTLTYTPTNAQWDGRFRAIKVKVERPGVKLSYRNGYYADDPNDRNRQIAGQAATAANRPTTMSTAMMRGGPDPTEILLRVRVRPAATPPGDVPVKDNIVNPDPKVKSGGPYKEYGVDVVPDRRAINCPVLADGSRRCNLEIQTFVYDRDGQIIVTTSQRTSARLTPANYQNMLTNGMAFHQEVSVPVNGEYFLRTAVHDLVSDRVGAVEISVAAVAKLAPLKPLPAPPPVLVPVPAAGEGTSPINVPAASSSGASTPPVPTISGMTPDAGSPAPVVGVPISPPK